MENYNSENMHILPHMNVSELHKVVWKRQLKLSLFPHYTNIHLGAGCHFNSIQQHHVLHPACTWHIQNIHQIFCHPPCCQPKAPVFETSDNNDGPDLEIMN